MTKYTITNDWHIGSAVCQHQKIINLLKHLDTQVLVLNGDIIDIDHVRRLKKKDWEILTLLRKLSKHVRIIYLPGNHDRQISELISNLLGLEHMDKFEVLLGDKKALVIHGDGFDNFLSKYWLVTEIATGLYYYLQKFSTKRQVIARSLKRRSKRFIKCCENIKKGAKAFARAEKYDYIICGHTHASDIDLPYINTGCFTEVDCAYVEIGDDNVPTIKHI